MNESFSQTGRSRVELPSLRRPKIQFVLLVSSIVMLAVAALVIRETNTTRSLVRTLRQGNEPSRREAASGLNDPSVVDLKIAIPGLADALADDSSAEVRFEAAQTLGPLGAAAIRLRDQINRDRARDALTSAIVDKEPKVRQIALSMIPVLAVEATNLSDNENDVRLVGDPGSVVAKIFPALNDPIDFVRVAAGTALGYFPIQLDPSLPMLLKAAVDEKPSANPRARGVMTSLFRKVRPMPSSLPFLMESIGSDNLKVRSLAVSALGQMSTDAESAVPALIRILKDPAGADEPDDPGRAAATALGAIAPETSKADEGRTALKEAQADAPEGRKRAISAALRNFEAAP